MKNNVLIAIGEALIDFIPSRKGCAFDDVPSFIPCLGGAPANVCGAFARLGGKARLITQLGDDPFGHKILRELAADGVDTSCIQLTDKANTSLAFVSLSADGDRTFSFYRNPAADMLLSPDQIKPDWFRDAFALHFCSVSLGDFPMKKAHREAIRLARDEGCIVSFDPNLRFPLWKDERALRKTVLEFIPKADILKISEEELAFVSGEQETDKAAHRMLSEGVSLVLVTMGARGAAAYTERAYTSASAPEVQAVDTTGAGDGFIGSFLWSLNRDRIHRNELGRLDRETLRDYLRFSNRFCSLSVAHTGAIPSYPTIRDLSDF